MEFRSSNHFSQFFHVSWLNVYDIKALVSDILMPDIDSKVIGREKGLLVRVYRNGVYMVSVSISVDPSRRCLYHEVHGDDGGHS